MNFQNLLGKNKLISRTYKAIFYGVGGATGSRVLMLASNVLLSRILGQEVFGQFSSVNNTVNLFVTFSGVGVSAALTRYIAAYRDDPKRTGMYIGTMGKICMVMSMLLSVCLLLFSSQISQLSSGNDTLTGYFRIVAFTVFFASMSSVEQSIMVGYEQFRKSSVIQLMRCAFFCLFGFIFAKQWNISGAVIATLLSQMLQFIWYRKENRKLYVGKHVEPVWNWNNATKEATCTCAIPAFISGLFVMPIHWIGNAMLTRTVGFAEMAIFSVSNQWMQYITYIPGQMGQMRPIYTDLYVRGEKENLRKLMIKISVITTLAAAAIGLGVILFGDFILATYGTGYLSGKTTFSLMVFAAILYTAQVQTGFLLQAMNKMWMCVAINGVWGIVLLFAYWFLLDMGATGYAISYCLAYLVGLGIQIFVMFKHLR